jgi:hypothetical protein
MKPTNHYEKLLSENGKSILTCEDPVPLLTKLHDGTISRFDCWNILRLIHAGEFNCNLPQYGTMTVFSLSKDPDEFRRLYDQGCEMLRENGQLSAEDEAFLEEDAKKEKVVIKIELSPKKKNKSAKKKKKPIDKDGLGGNFNNRFN